jgi:uncharacterized protein (DUF983 family)
MFGRALRRRCAVCGQGHLFRHWVTMTEDCPRCHLHFERARGTWTGAVGLNTVVSFGATLATMLILTLTTYPSVPITTLLVSTLSVALVVPVAFLPYSKTIWLAIDVATSPLEPGEAQISPTDGDPPADKKQRAG